MVFLALFRDAKIFVRRLEKLYYICFKLFVIAGALKISIFSMEKI
jgi:hypothetical protein